MICFYNTQSRELYDRNVILTKREQKFLMLLCNNDVVTYEEFEKNDFSKTSVKTMKFRLMEKTFLQIILIPGVGCKLVDKIYFM